MSRNFIVRAQNIQRENFSPMQRYVDFCKWIFGVGLPVKSLRFWFVLSLLVVAILMGVYVDPDWLGWVLGSLLILMVSLFLMLGYTQQILIDLILSVETNQKDIQVVSTGKTETEQTLFYLMAATDELRKHKQEE